MSEVKTDKLSPRTDSGTTTLGDSGDTFLVNTGAKIDINGTELILDADADTSITADTDDQIDIRIAGADDFQFTANTFTALSGSTISIASGAVLSLDDGAVATPALTNTGDLNTGIYFPAADTVGVTAGGTEQFRFGSNPIPGGFKNLVHNGEFKVAQRGTVTSPASGAYLTDRWKNWQTTGGAVTITQDTSGVFAEWGTNHAMKIDVTTAESSVASGDRFAVTHPFEAQDLQHLKYGRADAEAITLSFCFRSPKSGTHYAALYQADGGGRYCWRAFTVASANTAEYFSLTFVGDTGGTIDNNTAVGMNLYFPLMAGSNFVAGSENTWATDEKYAGATLQNLLDSTSNDIYIGRVQLEIGSVATDFEFEDYGTTLLKCQRYFWRQVGNDQEALPNLAQTSATSGWGYVQFPVTMRAEPTLSYSNLTHFGTQPNNAQQSPSVIALGYGSASITWINAQFSSSGSSQDSIRFYTINASATLDYSAEL